MRVLEKQITEPLDERTVAHLDNRYAQGFAILDMRVDRLKSGAGTVAERKGVADFAARWTVEKLAQLSVDEIKIRLAEEVEALRATMASTASPDGDASALIRPLSPFCFRGVLVQPQLHLSCMER